MGCSSYPSSLPRGAVKPVVYCLRMPDGSFRNLQTQSDQIPKPNLRESSRLPPHHFFFVVSFRQCAVHTSFQS